MGFVGQALNMLDRSVYLPLLKSTKREPSMWECIDEMNTLFGSSGTLNVACKVGRGNKIEK